MNIKSLIDLIALGSGLIGAMLGAYSSIRKRQKEDRKNEAILDNEIFQHRIDAVNQSKMVQDIAIELERTYLEKVKENVGLLEEELSRTKHLLAEIIRKGEENGRDVAE